MSVTDEQLEQALHYLATTDEKYAEAKLQLERAEILRKRVRARIFLTVDGTVAERTAKAETAPDVEQADGDYVAAIGAYETYKAKRQRAELIVDTWRTVSSNRRAGMSV